MSTPEEPRPAMSAAMSMVEEPRAAMSMVEEPRAAMSMVEEAR